MQETFICPHCQKKVEITEALTHQIKEELKTDLVDAHKKEMAQVLKESELKIREKIEEEAKIKFANQENENQELKDRNKLLGDQLLDLNRLLRDLKTKDEQRELDLEKKITVEREIARNDALNKVSQEYRLKDLEKEKVINDLRKSLDDAKRKAEQGSMQTQGEVLELDIEETLRREFPDDEIEPVGKGISGADIRQVVKSPRGTVCGVILWELKRTKAWSGEWITKLNTDLRATKSHCGVIVSQVLPEEASKGIGSKQGIWITSYQLYLQIATLLRRNLLDIGRQKAIQANSATKAEHLYTYITSHEFRQQVEAMVEIFLDMNSQITKERVALEKIWKQRESQVTRLLMSTSNIVGGLHGSGAAISQIKGLNLLEIEDGISSEENKPTETTSNKVKGDQPNLLSL
jgi:hypothetical protein